MADNSLARQFLLPEKQVSLKVIFDNLRNYAIVGIFIAMAYWFQSGKATAPPMIFTVTTKASWEVEAWSCFGLAAVLFILNMWQSYHIVAGIGRLWDDDSKPSTNKKPSRPWYARLLIFLLALALTGVALVIFMILFNLVIFLVWFAAVGSIR